MSKQEIILELQQTQGYKNWIADSEVLMICCDRFGTVRVIVKDRTRYSVLRFFKFIGNENWQVSTDVNDKTAEVVMNYLMVQLSEEIR